MRRRTIGKQRVHDGKSLDRVVDGAVVNCAVEIAGFRIDAAGELSCDELVDVVGVAP